MVHELAGVGQNLQDHIGVVSQFGCTQPVTLARSATPLGTLWAGIKYLIGGGGDASFPPTAGGAFIKSHPSKDLPDMQIHYVSAAMADVHGRAGVTPARILQHCLCLPSTKSRSCRFTRCSR